MTKPSEMLHEVKEKILQLHIVGGVCGDDGWAAPTCRPKRPGCRSILLCRTGRHLLDPPLSESMRRRVQGML